MIDNLKYFLTSILIIFLFGCGGGSNSSGAPPTNSGAVEDLQRTVREEGSDTVDLINFWDQIVLDGYSRIGRIAGYKYKDYLGINLEAEIDNVNIANDSVIIEVKQINHGAKTGDIVSFSGVKSPPFGFSADVFNKTFEIFDAELDAYKISIPAKKINSKLTKFIGNATYRYKECTGTQSAKQQPLDNTLPELKFNSTIAVRTITVVETILEGCSPAKSEFTTEKYYSKFPRQTIGNVRFSLLGQSIRGGASSLIDGDFNLPNGLLKSEERGAVSTMKNFTNFTRNEKMGRTVVTYEIMPHTTQSVFINFISNTYDESGNLIVTTQDIYGKSPTNSGLNYSLIQTLVKYNNNARTEVNAIYSESTLDVEPALYKGSGVIRGTPIRTQNWTFIPIDVTNFKAGSEIQIIINLGNGKSAASYDLFPNNNPVISASGTPVGSLANAYDVTPGSRTILKYKLPANKSDVYYLGVQGNWFSPVTDENTFKYNIWIK